MSLVYIHGANATSQSWNYIRYKCGDGIVVSYDSAFGFKNNLQRITKELSELNEIEFIAHSLGGIYAIHLAEALGDKVKCGITLSTPYNGLECPLYAKVLMPWYLLLYDITPNGWPIKTANTIKLKCPWTNIVTTSGSMPWVKGENDGVVSIDSQKHRKDIELIEIDCNHYEVVLNHETVNIINSKI